MAVRLRRVGFVIPAEPVTVSWPGGLFLGQAVVALSHPEHQRIHYTLDGSAPTPDSPRYEKPIVVSGEGATLRALSLDAEGLASAPVTRVLRRTVPRPSRPGRPASPGLRVRVYEGQWTRLPDIEALVPLRTAVTPGLDLAARPGADDFGLVFEGFVNVPADDIYTFTTISDDGTRLFIDGQLVVDNDGQHAPQAASGEIALARGWHALRLEFFEARGGEALSVEWQRPGRPREPIQEGRLRH
jgi:alpha-L-fucosidase